LDGSKTIPDKLPKAKVDFSAVRGDLHIDDLWFRYMKNDSAPWAVRELNCLIPARSRVAIIGKNGSAKTTLAYLMSGLLEPTQGIIRIDANDLCAYGMVMLNAICTHDTRLYATRHD
jgi:ABC-type bacteriocin/lantibiotic exporter with double-glycine peptidase domain